MLITWYSPWNRSFSFYYKNQGRIFSEEEILVSCIVKNKTSVFELLDTVILNEKKKTALLGDIKALSLLITGAYNLDIYILNISSMDDSSLGELFTKLPAYCVILLEDINAVDTSQDKTSSLIKGKSQGRVSLSALLNVLDSISSQEGRVLIMTTNHAERLDATLIRPGRVDMKLELGYTNQDINARLFCALFMRDDTLPDGSGRGDKVTLRKLMTEFTNKMPEQEFSPAEIQSFLLEYRRSPHMAVENVQEWVVRTREGKRQMKRVDSWVLQEGGDTLD
ncbi:mitochondrial chaperone bcs1 [Hyaloscypha sp. PMI_1271]|nr:mitochondrial chaperone bcs1 [Hyaloscypha sp. PMI_1271]